MSLAATVQMPARAPEKSDVPLWRLYLLRLLFAAIGLLEGSQIWPIIIQHGSMKMMSSVAFAMLGALTVAALLGIRYPLQMLPLLFFEILWKVIWLAGFALPEAMKGPLSPDYAQTVFETGAVVIVPLIIPWRYVFANYVTKHGDRWR